MTAREDSDRDLGDQPDRRAAPVALDGPALQMALRATIADLWAEGADPRDIAVAMFGSEADREACFDRRGRPDPLQQREAGE